ncbi:two-component regulator propeller domain-containing protein [Sphingobacterium siyangense]|uniref:two-component regulator propeller domain-containing protein n=1 Tax=Sphingobacterium TaxID=28453 RepID=UPI002FDD529E
MRGIGLLIFFTTLLLCRAVGQQPYAHDLQQLSDLPSKHVYCIYQDHKGFIWLATEEGLFGYDGFTYTNHKSEIQTTVVGSNIQEDK